MTSRPFSKIAGQAQLAVVLAVISAPLGWWAASRWSAPRQTSGEVEMQNSSENASFTRDAEKSTKAKVSERRGNSSQPKPLSPEQIARFSEELRAFRREAMRPYQEAQNCEAESNLKLKALLQLQSENIKRIEDCGDGSRRFWDWEQEPKDPPTRIARNGVSHEVNTIAEILARTESWNDERYLIDTNDPKVRQRFATDLVDANIDPKSFLAGEADAIDSIRNEMLERYWKLADSSGAPDGIFSESYLDGLIGKNKMHSLLLKPLDLITPETRALHDEGQRRIREFSEEQNQRKRALMSP